MATSTKKIIRISVVALVLAAVGLGLWMWNKPHKDIKNAHAIDITAENYIKLLSLIRPRQKQLISIRYCKYPEQYHRFQKINSSSRSSL